MTDHTIGTRAEWLAARLKLLDAEKALTRRGDEVAQQRQALPWVRVDKTYGFETEEGQASLADLFAGRSQLLIYHFMFGPDYNAGCPSCSAIADGFDGSVVHLANHDVSLVAVSRAPLPQLLVYRKRMGWNFPWASSFGGDFNYDYGVSHTAEDWRAGAVDYNFRSMDVRPSESGAELPFLTEWASGVGTDWPTYRQEGPGMSAFVLEDGEVYHAYSTYERGVDAIWGMYSLLDRAPRGRNENGMWWRRHDEYEASH
ncbi:MAG: thioredoxin family protein [Microbacteriaceae bacterium]